MAANQNMVGLSGLNHEAQPLECPECGRLRGMQEQLHLFGVSDHLPCILCAVCTRRHRCDTCDTWPTELWDQVAQFRLAARRQAQEVPGSPVEQASWGPGAGDQGPALPDSPVTGGMREVSGESQLSHPGDSEEASPDQGATPAPTPGSLPSLSGEEQELLLKIAPHVARHANELMRSSLQSSMDEAMGGIARSLESRIDSAFSRLSGPQPPGPVQYALGRTPLHRFPSQTAEVLHPGSGAPSASLGRPLGPAPGGFSPVSGGSLGSLHPSPRPVVSGLGTVGQRFVGPPVNLPQPWTLPLGRGPAPFAPSRGQSPRGVPLTSSTHGAVGVEPMDTSPATGGFGMATNPPVAPPVMATGGFDSGSNTFGAPTFLATGGPGTGPEPSMAPLGAGGAWGNPGSHTPSVGSQPLSRHSQARESMGSASYQSLPPPFEDDEPVPAYALPPDMGRLVRHMSRITGVQVTEPPPVETSGWLREGEDAGPPGAPGLIHSNRLAVQLSRQGALRARGRMRSVDNDIRRNIRMSPTTYEMAIRPLPLPQSLQESRMGVVGDMVQRLQASPAYKSWTMAEEVARAGFRATELMALTQVYLESHSLSSLEGEALDEAFPEEVVSGAWCILRACLESCRGQLARSVSIAVYERRLATLQGVGWVEKEAKQFRDHLLHAPFFSPEDPDLFAGRYDATLQRTADHMANRAMVEQARQGPQGYLAAKKQKVAQGGSVATGKGSSTRPASSNPPGARASQQVREAPPASRGAHRPRHRRGRRGGRGKGKEQPNPTGGSGARGGSGRGRGSGRRS